MVRMMVKVMMAVEIFGCHASGPCGLNDGEADDGDVC